MLIFANYLFFHLIIWVRFPYVYLTDQIFILNKLFCLFIWMFIISLELTRVNPDRNIFAMNVELTSTFLLYRGLVFPQIPRLLNPPLPLNNLNTINLKNHVNSKFLTVFKRGLAVWFERRQLPALKNQEGREEWVKSIFDVVTKQKYKLVCLLNHSLGITYMGLLKSKMSSSYARVFWLLFRIWIL